MRSLAGRQQMTLRSPGIHYDAQVIYLGRAFPYFQDEFVTMSKMLRSDFTGRYYIIEETSLLIETKKFERISIYVVILATLAFSEGK